MISLEDAGKGLDPNQVLERLKKYGYNEISSEKPNPMILILKKFWGFTPLMLLITIILEIIIGKIFEAYVITALLLFNSLMSYFQERKANLVLELLKSKLQVKARVKRQGEWTLIPARELVPDDLVRLRSGDFVPADIIILEGYIEVDQSSITGESIIIEKEYNQLIYAGSIVKRGEATGRIKATASHSFLGHTIQLVELAKPKFNIQIMISKIVKWLILMVVFSISTAIIFSIIKKLNLLDLIPLFVILLIASIPIALPTMFTISMALGSFELSKKNVLITRLDAVEDVAMMDVICADKTGTLTMNVLQISKLINNSKYEEDDIILYGALASQEADQDPIDLAFIRVMKEKNLHYDDYIQKKFLPFDPMNRRTEALIERDAETFLIVKGAINIIFNMCNLSQIVNFKDIQNKMSVLSASGYRLIAVAFGKDKNNLDLVGVAALYDQIRPEIYELIQKVNDLGISLKMLTGDALPIAKEVAKNVGIGNNVISYSDFKDLVKENDDFKILENIDGFAEIYPEDKYLIVKDLQKLGHVVGMTGDGVNDAPALRQSEVGIAVKSSTDVAKKASSVVLTEETLEGIIDLIKIGRRIYQRINIWILNKIIRTFKRVLFIILAFMIFSVYIVSALNMIILLFLSDYVTLSLSTDQVSYSQKPESGKINKLIKVGIILGFFIVLEGLIILIIGDAFFRIFNDLNHVYTYTFVFLVYSGYFTILAVREKEHFWHSKPSKFLAIAIIINSFFVFLISTYGLIGFTPIPIIEFMVILFFCFFSCLIFNDFIKWMLIKKFKE